MRICRRLFVVPLGNDHRGKTTAINALVSQGRGETSPGHKGQYRLVSPAGRKIDAHIFGRSYQEYEKGPHGTVKNALDANDHLWRERELIICPSHGGGRSRVLPYIDELIAAAHEGGFDAICASFLITGDKADVRASFADIWSRDWDERWTLPNPRRDEQRWQQQVEAIGRDLWTWICRALVS
jgi:hypothetical protein